MENINQKKDKLVKDLFHKGCIKFGSFKLKLHQENPEAPLSPIYINLRILRSFPDLMLNAVQHMIQATCDVYYDIVADVPTAGTPLATLFSYLTKSPLISPRKEKKDTGTLDTIDGVFNKHLRVLLIDDLITRAESKIETIKKLTENDLIVNDIVVLIDREQGGKHQMQEYGIKLHSVLTISEMMEYYFSEHLIDKNKYNEVMNYIETNR
jgi:uridine monophosphate synthetase